MLLKCTEMKSLKYIHYHIPLVLILFLSGLCLSQEVNAKISAAERVRMKLYYSKNDDGERLISIGLTAGNGKNMHGLKNARVLLTSIITDSTTTLATLETDTIGQVNLYLATDYILPMDEDGKTTIRAFYKGNEEYRSTSKEIEISDLNFEFYFDVEDSIKYLNLKANRIDRNGRNIPVKQLEVSIGVQRLYSILPLDKVETDDNGIGVLEVPNDLPGDSVGVITFVARIEDHDEFGTVTKSSSQAWGIPVSYDIKPLPRQLYTDEAPLWMIMAVFIILLGAWYHFFLSISKLIKMKKSI